MSILVRLIKILRFVTNSEVEMYHKYRVGMEQRDAVAVNEVYQSSKPAFVLLKMKG